MRSRNNSPLLLIPFLFSLMSPVMATETDGASVTETMQQSLKSLSYLIDVALDSEFDRTEDDEFLRNLELMQSLSTKIAEHTEGIPHSLHLVTHSLDETIRQMVANYKSGFNATGEVYLIETIDHCVACHTQSSNLKNDNHVDELLELIYSEEVHTSVAARMMIAARRFPEAIQLWEEKLLNRDFALDQSGAETTVLEYISQVVHLDEGAENVAKILEFLKQQETTPYYFKRKLDIWLQQVALTNEAMFREPTLDSIQELKEECVKLEGISVREEYLVCSILVSSASATMLRDLAPGNEETEAKLYINMGVARLDSGLPAGYVPLIESYLEAAIITSPDSEVAKQAYAYLEELAYYLYDDIDVAEEIMDVSFKGLRDLAGIY